MVRVVSDGITLCLAPDESDELDSAIENQLALWRFRLDAVNCCFVAQTGEPEELLPKVVRFLERAGVSVDLDANARELLLSRDHAANELARAIEMGGAFKAGLLSDDSLAEAVAFLRGGLARQLKPHQIKSALHLIITHNGANFSVPGSGKTSVVLAAFEWLRRNGEVDALFVVGPPSCFGPWRDEYRAVLGEEPGYEILAGGNAATRQTRYQVTKDLTADLYLTTFQTLQRDWAHVRRLFELQGIRFFFVVDEAHYIKQADGAWASAVLAVARRAARRCVLTGTPFPKSYEDGYNLFDTIWPTASPIPAPDRHRIGAHLQHNDLSSAAGVLERRVGPLFYRVRKSDLGLAPQILEPPTLIEMNQYERLVYDTILDRVRGLSKSDFLRNYDLVARLRRGRMTRIRQCLSYAPLLASAVTEYEEDLADDELALSDVIMHYDQLETPGKLAVLLRKVGELVDAGEKVVVWSNFIRTLFRLSDEITSLGIGTAVIFGGTPIQRADIAEELTREDIVQAFNEPDSAMRVLVANPAACAESISLHKSCSHAIYYDLSYNCAQYLQSLDRIHRVGGSENRPSHYSFLQYAGTIDADILENVQGKAENMSRIIDQDCPIYSLDMFAEDEEIQAYERLFGRKV